MPGIHASSFSKPVNVHGVVPQQLVSLSYLCQSFVPGARLGFTSLCIDVSKERLHGCQRSVGQKLACVVMLQSNLLAVTWLLINVEDTTKVGVDA